MSYSSTAGLGALSSLDASIGAALRRDAVLAEDRLTAETRFDPQSGPRAAAWTARATSRLGRAAASRRLPTPEPVAPAANECRLMTSATQPSDPRGSVSMRIRGGVDAPSRARRSVVAQLGSHIAPTTASDVALVVSDLVTNSVLHANVGPRRTLTLELTTLDDRVRISVIDPGSRLEPRILPSDHQRVGGAGLLIVNELSEAWGVAHHGKGGTRVWCDIPLDRSQSSELRAVASEAASVSPS